VAVSSPIVEVGDVVGKFVVVAKVVVCALVNEVLANVLSKKNDV
jgi:hypothetical protein